MTADATHVTFADIMLIQDDNQTAPHRVVTAPDEAVSRLLDGEQVWVPRTLLPAIQRTFDLVQAHVKARRGG